MQGLDQSPRLVPGLFVLGMGHRLGYDTASHGHLPPATTRRDRPDEDAEVQRAVESQVTQRAAIRTPRGRFEFGNDLLATNESRFAGSCRNFVSRQRPVIKRGFGQYAMKPSTTPFVARCAVPKTKYKLAFSLLKYMEWPFSVWGAVGLAIAKSLDGSVCLIDDCKMNGFAIGPSLGGTAEWLRSRKMIRAGHPMPGALFAKHN